MRFKSRKQQAAVMAKMKGDYQARSISVSKATRPEDIKKFQAGRPTSTGSEIRESIRYKELTPTQKRKTTIAIKQLKKIRTPAQLRKWAGKNREMLKRTQKHLMVITAMGPVALVTGGAPPIIAIREKRHAEVRVIHARKW